MDYYGIGHDQKDAMIIGRDLNNTFCVSVRLKHKYRHAASEDHSIALHGLLFYLITLICPPKLRVVALQFAICILPVPQVSDQHHDDLWHSDSFLIMTIQQRLSYKQEDGQHQFADPKYLVPEYLLRGPRLGDRQMNVRS